MDIKETATDLFMKALLKTPKGRAHLLNQVAEGEDRGEAGIFAEMIEHVEDDRFKKMIERHQADEIRHGQLFAECMERTGYARYPVPQNLDMLAKIDERMDGFFQRKLSGPDDVVTAYLVLQAIEERALDQFRIYEKAFERYDAKTSKIFREVARDEERHLRYCQAIVRHYVEDEQQLEERLNEIRRIEAEVFREVEAANMEYVQNNKLISSGLSRFIWRQFGRLRDLVDELPLTTFAQAALAKPATQAA